MVSVSNTDLKALRETQRSDRSDWFRMAERSVRKELKVTRNTMSPQWKGI